MAGKQSGLGSNFYVGEYDLSGDTNSLSQLASPHPPLPATGLNVYANERMEGHRDGLIAWNTFFNPTAGFSHAALSGLPKTDRICSFFVGGSAGPPLGGAVASMVGKQIGYDGTRAVDGSFTLDVQALANGYGLEWGQSLTAGKETDATGTDNTSVDFLAATSFGWQAYLHVFSLTGTNIVVTLYDSANNSAFATFTGSAFTSITSATGGSQRLQSASSTATVRRYVRVTTSGTFTNAVFAVNFVKNTGAVLF